jgi:hypothetical protein
LWPGSSNVFASSAIFGHAALVSGKAIAEVARRRCGQTVGFWALDLTAPC